MRQIDFALFANYSRDRKRPASPQMISAIKNGDLISEQADLLKSFVDFLGRNEGKSTSQLFQDMFAAFVIGETHDKTFLEFGAADGLNLSNSNWLEHIKNWQGVLCEPSPQWHDRLKANRPKTRILTDCIWRQSGVELDFFVSENGEFSTLAEFRYSDTKAIPGRANLRKNGYHTKVSTISLNDVMESFFSGRAPSYISIDTEGSEFDILSNFDLKQYRPKVFTIEHNFTEAEEKITQLLADNGYTRIFQNLTAFDAWYVEDDLLQELISRVDEQSSSATSSYLLADGTPPGRNAPCPCGSGKKFKHCHGALK